MTTTPDLAIHLDRDDRHVVRRNDPMRRASRVLSVLLLLLTLSSSLLVVGVALEFGLWTHEEVIRGPFRTEAGTRTAWVPVGQRYTQFFCCVGVRKDTDEHATASSLRAWLNGRELAPPHTSHDDIRRGNTAGFSHREDNTIRFVIPQSVVNDQAATLRVRYPVQYSIEFLNLNALVAIVLAVLVGARIGAPPILWFIPTIALSTYIVAVYLLESPPVPLIAFDTESYWYSPLSHHIYSALYTDAFSMRPLGYAVVLHAVHNITGSLKYIPAIQSGAYCLAVLALQAAAWRLTRNIAFGTMIGVALLLHHALLYYSIWALSEQLFIAFLALHVAAAAWALASHSRAALVLMALTAVGIISLRPAGSFILVAILLFCLFWRGNRVFALRWAVLPLVVAMAMFMGVGLAVRGIAIDRLGGWAALPYVAYMYDGSGDVPPIAKQAIMTTLQPYIKGHREAERVGVFAVADYEANHFNDITYGLFARLEKVLPGQDIGALEGRIAMETIKRHPSQYGRLVFINIVGGLRFAIGDNQIYPADMQNYYRQQKEPTRVLSKLIGGLGSFDIETDATRYDLLRDYPLPRVAGIGRSTRRALLFLFAMVALVSVFVGAFRHPSRLSYFTAYTSVLAIGGYMFVGATTVFISRYAEPMDVFIVVVIASGILCGARVLQEILALARSQPLTGVRAVAMHENQ